MQRARVKKEREEEMVFIGMVCRIFFPAGARFCEVPENFFMSFLGPAWIFLKLFISFFAEIGLLCSCVIGNF